MIVVAEKEHFEDWLELRKQVYTGLNDHFHLREMANWLSESCKRCWIAYRDDEAVGFVEASLRNIVDGCLSSPVGYVEGIYVSPDQRGQGLARDLLATAEEWMRAEGCTEVGTDAELGNSAAISFHKAMGFEETYHVVEFRKALDADPHSDD